MGKRKSKRNKTLFLPEVMIQHIQSFMSAKEAARSATLSKSWYNAFLTRPTVDLDDRYLSSERRDMLEEFAKKTVQRYRDSSLKIQSFRLITYFRPRDDDFARNLIVSTLEAGAVDLTLDVWVWPSGFPQEVLVSKTLLQLCVSHCIIDGNYVISGSRLKSLTLKSVVIRYSELFKNIMISCCDSLETLSLSSCHGLILSRENLNELHELRRLYLCSVQIGSMFFTDFASRFPCLKDLFIACKGCTSIDIATTSLQTISFNPDHKESWRAKFYLPNIQKFTLSTYGLGLSSYGLGYELSIDGASKEWKFDITIACTHLYNVCWLQQLERMLTKFRLSRISLFLKDGGWSNSEHEVGIDPIVVESLMIETQDSIRSCLLIRLFRIFHPKFITHEWFTDHPWLTIESINVLCKKLMKKLVTPNCWIPDWNMFGQFGLKKVTMEVYEMLDDDKCWRPLVLEKPMDAIITPKNRRKVQTPKNNKRKIRFELLWD